VNWLIIGSCFYFAWGAILYLDRTEAELDAWRDAAIARAMSKGVRESSIPGRSVFAWAMLLLTVCWWPFLKRETQ
jgi:hypothetical protein